MEDGSSFIASALTAQETPFLIAVDQLLQWEYVSQNY
jgi:hypothetical protein